MVSFPQASPPNLFLHAPLLKPTRATCVAHLILHDLITLIFGGYTDHEDATSWTVRRSNPGGGEIFRTCPDLSWWPPSFLYDGHRVIPGGKEAGAWRLPTTPSSTEYRYTFTPHLGLHGMFSG